MIVLIRPSPLSQLYRKWLATIECLAQHTASELRDGSIDDASSTLKDLRRPPGMVDMLDLKFGIRMLVMQQTRQTL